jgi:hypothetical protein
MKRNFFNSPLEKGDKGGCGPLAGALAETVPALSGRNGRGNQETTPFTPFPKGEYLGYFTLLPVSNRTYGLGPVKIRGGMSESTCSGRSYDPGKE